MCWDVGLQHQQLPALPSAAQLFPFFKNISVQVVTFPLHIWAEKGSSSNTVPNAPRTLSSEACRGSSSQCFFLLAILLHFFAVLNLHFLETCG